MEIKTFVIRPVQRHSFQSRHLQRIVVKDAKTGTVTSEKIMNKSKAQRADGNSCTDVLKCQRNELNRDVYDMGLNEQIPNPFYEINADKREEAASNIMSNYALHEEWRKVINSIVANKNISKQQELEIRFRGSSPPGTLTQALPSARLHSFRSIIDPAAPRTELMDFKLVLYDRTNRFSTNTLKGALTWQLINGRHPRVAVSRDRINPAKHMWYLAEEHEDQKIAEETNNLMDEAIFEIVSLKRKYPTTEVLEENVIYHLASVIMDKDHKPLIKGKATYRRINEVIDAFIKPKVKTDIPGNVKKFNEALELFNKNKELFYARYIVQQALNYRIFQINNSKVYWLSQKDSPDVYKFTSISGITKFVYEEMLAVESTYWDRLIMELDAKDAVIPKTLKE